MDCIVHACVRACVSECHLSAYINLLVVYYLVYILRFLQLAGVVHERLCDFILLLLITINVLYCIVLYCIVLCCIHGIVLYCIVMYCTVLYCTVLYCIVLYCIILYCIVLRDIVAMPVLYSTEHTVCHCLRDFPPEWHGSPLQGGQSTGQWSTCRQPAEKKSSWPPMRKQTYLSRLSDNAKPRAMTGNLSTDTLLQIMVMVTPAPPPPPPSPPKSPALLRFSQHHGVSYATTSRYTYAYWFKLITAILWSRFLYRSCGQQNVSVPVERNK